jgi:type II secretory pathway component PulK
MRRRPTQPDRRGLILPVALLVLGLLTVLAAKVVFRSNADIAAVQAAEAALKARMAAEAGVQKVIAVLQGSPGDSGVIGASADQPRGRADMDAWYDNPDYFRGLIVQGATAGGSSGVIGDALPGKVSFSNPATWRFSVVASDPLALANDAAAIRYGITDEASKLNLNVCTQDQLARLITFVVRNQQVNADDLAKAILYYRTKPKDGQLDEAEEAYYQALDQPYSVKYGPFDSVEEVLMVRGMTGQILFGEDWNRNSFLDGNENDGDNLFPPDNSDGQLERGLYPFLTVWSSEPNTNNSNKPRINLNTSNMVELRKKLPDYYTEEEKNAIIEAVTGRSLTSPVELFTGENAGIFSPEAMAGILNDFTTSKTKTLTGEKTMNGMVNVNTAPVEVLVAIGFTEDEAHSIVTARSSLTPEDRTSIAWLVGSGVIDTERLGDPDLFKYLTARAYQFRVESIGFADHVGTFCRLEVVLKMKGRTCQVAYWRDLSSLGLGWPVHGQEGSSFALNTH